MEVITIVMPNYNKGAYLKDTVASLLRQVDPNWRAIVLDDGSSDGSRCFLEEDSSLRDPRISVLFNEQRRGKAWCMNRLVELAQTGIIGELDSDDVLHEECVRDVLAAYRRSDSGFVYTNFTYCNSALKPLRKGYSAPIPEGRTALELDCIAHFRTFRKSAYLKTGGLDESLTSAVDKDLIYKLEEVTTPYFVDRELYYYRMHRNSLSWGEENKKRGLDNHRIIKARALARRTGSDAAALRSAVPAR